MSDAVTGCAQTPLWDLLRRIPQEAVYGWAVPEEGRELWRLGWSSSPIGRLAHEAADALEALAASPSVVGWDREICTGCTSSLSIDDIKAMGVVSCCPDRHMVRVGDLIDAYTARPPRILPQTDKGS